MDTLRKRDSDRTKEAIEHGRARILSARSLQDLERRYQVWKLRTQGYSMTEIASAVGINVDQARKDLVVVAKRLVSDLSETVEESRLLQTERLDSLLKQYQPLAEGGNLSAAAMVLAIEGRRSKLLALDVPETKKLDVTAIREYVGINLEEV